ncbi:hypothetical protein OMAG_002271 [Candidatus Omnitrophus magneticus]|uniref:Secreted protein n=1 Tax=Candidatus Omnitrophus magneticus TaxID=1609969 RepID=A0A0F0CR00_9BACT|nr:hypothetical protein OMAG_002271 [Candidatus Omnitrophus magneticus]
MRDSIVVSFSPRSPCPYPKKPCCSALRIVSKTVFKTPGITDSLSPAYCKKSSIPFSKNAL